MGRLKDFFLGQAEVPTFDTNGHGPKFGITVPYEIVQGDAAGNQFSHLRISRRDALQVPAVLRSRNLIAGTLSTLPIHIRDKDKRMATPTTLLEQIDPDLPNVVTFANTYEDLLFESVSWWRILEFGWHTYPVAAQHVSVDRVHATPSGVFIDGLPVRDELLIRFDSPNPPLLVHAARAIRTCLRLDKTAALYADSPTSLGYFAPKEGVPDLDEDKIEQLLDKWEESRRRHAYGYVGAAWELGKLGYTAEEIQLMDQRQHAVLEIARATGLDPEDLGVSTTSRTYQNSEQRRLDLLDFTLSTYVAAVEQRLSMRDVIPRGYRTKVNFDGFLRSDTKTRMETHEIGIRTGVTTQDEARDLEDRPPLTDAEKQALQPEPQPMELVNE